MREKRENELIGQFILFYWVVCKNKNWDVGCIVGWVGKIDKVMFEDVNRYFYTSPIASTHKLYIYNLTIYDC